MKEGIIISQGMNQGGIIIIQNRTWDPINPKQLFSEVWTNVCDGAKDRAKEKSVNLKTLIPKNYHDREEFLNLVEEGVKSKPDFLILPFTLIQSDMEKKFLDILSLFDGEIFAVNVPPDSTAIRELGNKLKGYVGSNEVAAGKKAVKELILSAKEIKHIVILRHEVKQYAQSLRVQGIKEVAEQQGISVEEVYFKPEEQKVILSDKLKEKKFGIITLGNRGTEAALSFINPDQVLGLVGMDMNDKTVEAILNSKMKCTLIQHPYMQGVRVIDMVLEPSDKEFKEIFCGPTLVDSDNVLVFNRQKDK